MPKRNTARFGNSRFWLSLLVLVTASLVGTGCVQQSRGFALPEGDAERGKQLFVNMSCNHCHSIGDIEWVGSDEKLHIELGGEVTKIKTYGELVTSVINPSHEIAGEYKRTVNVSDPKSPMEAYYYNEVMTVEELTNIVTFLQSEYDVVAPEDTYYYGR